MLQKCTSLDHYKKAMGSSMEHCLEYPNKIYFSSNTLHTVNFAYKFELTL